MDELNELALNALNSAVTAFLPASVPGGLTRRVQLLPEAVRPAGIGGYIGTYADPQGLIYGRYLSARILISLQGGNDANAAAYLQQIIDGLLQQHHGDLRRAGIQSLKLLPDSVDSRNAQFDLAFEYRHLPTVGGDVIETLDLSVENNYTPYRTRFLWDLAGRTLIGSAAPLEDFFAPASAELNLSAGSPDPQWSFNDAEGRIEQTSAAKGGLLTLSQALKAGPQLLWRPAGRIFNLSRFIAVVEFESGSPDGIGLVFGRTDGENLWYFLASNRHQYHLFGCREAGNYSFVGTPTTGIGFNLNTRHVLNLTVFDRTLIATLDGVQTLAVTSNSPVSAGELGFFTHGNNDARFYRVRLIELI